MRFLPAIFLSSVMFGGLTHTHAARQSTLGACLDGDNKISLYKDTHQDSYKLVFENLNDSAKPDWVDIHVHSPSVGEANVRILSDGKLLNNKMVSQPGLVVRDGETLTHFVTYGLHDGTACNTKTMQFTRNDGNMNMNMNMNMNNNNVEFSTAAADNAMTTPLSSSLASESMLMEEASNPCPSIKLQRRLVITPSHENTYKLIFDIPTNSTNNVDYLELHYKVNDRPLTNLRLGNTLIGGSSVSQDGIVLKSKDTLSYFATYSVGGSQCDTNTYQDTLEE